METSYSKQLLITSVRPQARDIKSFDLSLAEPGEISFLPGQVAILKVKNEAPAYFAFASAPEDRELEVLVKKKIGASNIIFDMREGETIELTGIAGHGFALDAQKGKDLVFVGMGTGVAPLRSALRQMHPLSRRTQPVRG